MQKAVREVHATQSKPPPRQYRHRAASSVFAIVALFFFAGELKSAHGLASLGLTERTLKFDGVHEIGCAECHTPTPTQNLTVNISGPSALTAGQSAVYTITATLPVAESGRRLGINIAASDTPTPLSESAGNLTVLDGEIVHTTEEGTPLLATTDANGTASYAFTFTMPAGAAGGSSHTIYSTARIRGSWGHAPNFIVTARVDQPALTALFNGSATPSPVAFGANGTLASTGGAGGGAVTFVSSNSSVCAISGNTLSAAGTGTCTVTATKAGDSSYNAASDTFDLTVNQATQTIAFNPLINKFTTDPPFAVAATGGGSGNTVTFSASGVCTLGTATVTLTTTTGSCSITANQAGNANFLPAPPVTHTFIVLDAGSEVFPPNCLLPPGWFTPGGATDGWLVSNESGAASEGVCGLKSKPMPLPASGINRAQIAFTGVFNAGNIAFSRRVSSALDFDCFRLLIDGVEQNVAGSCAASGGNGASGNVPYGAISIPISAGAHTVAWSYEIDFSIASGADAAWIDQMTMPLSTTITSANFVTGTFGQPLSHAVTATNFPFSYSATGLPPGMSIDVRSGVISGTPSAGGTYNAMVAVSNPGGANPAASDLKSVTFQIDRAFQAISFAPISNKLVTLASFIISATGGASGNPVTFTTSGVCTASGSNGSTISLTGMNGTCTVFANQAGNANYVEAFAMQSFGVSNAADEIFPPACAMPSGWTVPVGATTGWNVSANEDSSTGACSLKSMPMANAGAPLLADIEFTGNFSAGNITFKYRVSSEAPRDCFQFFIDGALQVVGGACNRAGFVGTSGEGSWTSRTYAISAGTHTLRWRYDKDEVCCAAGSDAVWIDDVVLPLFTLTVVKAGTGNGSVTSTPAGIDCGLGGPCSAPLSGNVSLSRTVSFGSAFTGWSGGGCSGVGVCTVVMDANKTVTATFGPVTPPGAPQNVMATRGNAEATITFGPPASDGGQGIFQYVATCAATGQTTRTAVGFGSSVSTLTVTSLVNGVQYSCTVSAANVSGGSGPPSAPVLVTPVTVPDAPTGVTVMAGNAQATVSFQPPGVDGGSMVTGYTATCGSQSANGAGSPIIVGGLTNGATVNCTVRASNAAGPGTLSASVSVTPRTVPSAPVLMQVIQLDGRVIVDFNAPSNNGGSLITAYTAVCNPGAVTASVPAPSRLTVSGLSTGDNYSCSLVATNAAGNSTATLFNVTPLLMAGKDLYTYACSACHAMPPTVPQLNAAGKKDIVLSYVIAALPAMAADAEVNALTEAEREAVTAYLNDVITPASVTTPFNTPATIDLSGQIAVGTIAFENLMVGTSPSNGTLSVFNGTSITYTPNAGFVGTDSFTFRGSRSTPTMLLGDARAATINVSPPSLALINIVSRKPHGAAGALDIVIDNTIPLGGAVTTESRTIGTGHTLVFRFNNPITAAGGVAVTAGSASAAASGNDVVVTLTGIADNTRMMVTLSNVNGDPTAYPVSIGFLVGDVNNTRSVTASDISGVKARSGLTTTAPNVRFDVNATGSINAADISAVKARSGLTLPP